MEINGLTSPGALGDNYRMKTIRINSFGLFCLSLFLQGVAQGDVYEEYVKNSQDFKPVRMAPDVTRKAFPGWTYMPWYYQWDIGFDDAAGAFCAETGINGGFTDRGDTGHLAWMEKYKLRFYVDHVAGKGDLHQWDTFPKAEADRIHSTGIRNRPVNAGMRAKLERVIRENLEGVRRSPMRGAYSLDDEISWGHFVHPTMWQITDDAGAFRAWLKEVYGEQAPQYGEWMSYEQVRTKLAGWTAEAFDLSQLMDQWTFNDSCWNNFIGDLVVYANGVDPETPCGYAGGQCPNAFGGYDYAKLMRKVQFLEVYNMAGAQAIARALNPSNAIPVVTTFFHKQDSPADAAWQVWYYLAQGNRGHIAWVEKWFDGKTPKPWLRDIAATYKEAGSVIGPLVSDAQFRHDGVALYYSHASIQFGWMLDAVAHGWTWVNRNNDHILGSSHCNRMAWMHMLRDEGLQFVWLDYATVIQDGIPPHVKVLILPHALCLSDAEARRIQAFCRDGGTVIADYLPGVWDQHGKGRTGGGALDSMFGVRHDPKMTAKDVFQGDGELWCEVHQDKHYNDKTPEDLLRDNTCVMDAAGFHKAVRGMPVAQSAAYGKGKAVMMNLSPIWYLVYRHQGTASAAKRDAFMKPIHDAGLRRWVQIENADDKAFGYEITYWEKGGRTILFLIMNADITVSSEGGGGSVGLKAGILPVTLTFAKPISNARDERTGKPLGNGQRFQLQWKQNEACVISFDI